MIPLSVCSHALKLMEAWESGKFVSVSKRDAWMIHGLEDLDPSSKVYLGAYTEAGHIFFVGDNAHAYAIDIANRKLKEV